MNLAHYLNNEFLSRIKSLHLKTDLIIKGAMAGRHSSPFHGYSSEFSQYRSYVPGDNLRYLDWKIYAKTERPTIRQYQDETNANVYIIMDSSASMAYADHGMTKLEYGVILAGALSVLAYRNRDSLSLIAGADSPQIFTQPKNNPSNLKLIHRFLESLQPKGQSDLDNMFRLLAPRLRSYSMVYIFSDLWQKTDEIIRGLKSIRSKSQTVTLIQILTQKERQFFKGRDHIFQDMETEEQLRVSATQLKEEYLTRLWRHQRVIQSECHKMKARYISIDTSDSLIGSTRKIMGASSSSVKSSETSG